MSMTARVVTNRFAEIAAGMEPTARLIRQKTAADVAADWAEDVRVDTGAYRNSIQTAEDGDSSVAYSPLDYSVYNEFGTAKMAAKPSATRAAERHRGPYLEAMRSIVE